MSASFLRFVFRSGACWFALGTVVACAPESREGAPAPREHVASRSLALSTDISIDATIEHQHIVGFGASSAWTSPNLGQVKADQFFSKETGLGLSLLRIRIAPDGTTSETATALQAQERGAKVWAAPWSPPGAWKTNGTDNQGGSLLPEHYQDWADRLATFVENAEAAGVHLIALSAQNEPDWVADWETCEWTPKQLANFIGSYLGPTLDARGLTTKVLGPESANWDSFPSYSDEILKDMKAKDAIDILATHAYGGTPFGYTAPAEAGKELWETEVSDGDLSDDGINSGLSVAQNIHNHLTVANVNAWHFWWLQPNGSVSSSNSSLLNKQVMTRRGYTLGNYARFVRPGATRIEVTPQETGAVRVTAFKNADSGPLAIVAINVGTSVAPLHFSFTGATVASVTPWVTDDARGLEAQTPVDVVNEGFDYELPLMSVTTFVATPPNPGTGGSTGAGGATAMGGSAGAAGSGGAASGGVANGAGGQTGGAPDDDPPSTGGLEEMERPETPEVSCFCRTAGAPSPERPMIWLPVAGLLAVLAQRRLRRDARTAS